MAACTLHAALIRKEKIGEFSTNGLEYQKGAPYLLEIAH